MKGDLQGGCPLGIAPLARVLYFPKPMYVALGAQRGELLPNGELPIHWGAAATSVAVQALEKMKLKEISGGKINILMHVEPMQRELSFAVPQGFAHHSAPTTLKLLYVFILQCRKCS